MSGVTVEKFAETLKVSVDRLLEQLAEAGVTVTAAERARRSREAQGLHRWRSD